jgi:hypothetical protein
VSENWLLQHSVKIGADMVNLRGDNPDQFKQVLDWTIENAALFVNVQAALNSVPAALAGNVTRTQVVNDAPAQAVQQQQNAGGWGNQQQSPPSFANPASAGPACQHGPMVYRDKKNQDGSFAWRAHFCPTPKGTAGQCQPQFMKK